MSALEVCGFLTGAACVLLAMKEKILCWPVSMANDVLFFVVFWRSQLYAGSCLQVLYFAIAIYGWWRWTHSETGTGKQRIRPISRKIAVVLLVVTPIAWAGVYELLRRYTDSNVPAGDSLATVLSLAAQYMMGRKLLQNWLVWIVADVINIGLCMYKHLYLTSFLYTAFIVMCIAGFQGWRRTQSLQGDAFPG